MINVRFERIIPAQKFVYLQYIEDQTAPLIRFRPWHYINLFTYLLTYMVT